MEKPRFDNKTKAISFAGLRFYVDAKGWVKIYDPSNEGVWRGKGGEEMLLPIYREAPTSLGLCLLRVKGLGKKVATEILLRLEDLTREA
jgi:hypothetical protein